MQNLNAKNKYGPEKSINRPSFASVPINMEIMFLCMRKVCKNCMAS